MGISRFWNLLFISWCQIGLLSILCTIGVKAQYRGHNYNYLEYKNKDYYFGITLGASFSRYQVSLSEAFISDTEYRAIQGVGEPGFHVGGIVNYKIGDYFDIRVMPAFTFATRTLQFCRNQPGLANLASCSADTLGFQFIERETTEPILVNLPFQLRFKSAPYKDKRAYVALGVNYSYNVAADIDEQLRNNMIPVNPHDFQVELAVGMQLFFPYFILSPEIKFSQGLNNILLHNDQIERTNLLERLLSQGLTLSFHFEG